MFNADRACQSCIHEQPSLLSLNNCTARPYQGMPNPPCTPVAVPISLSQTHMPGTGGFSIAQKAGKACSWRSKHAAWLARISPRSRQSATSASCAEGTSTAGSLPNQASAALPQPQTASGSGSISSLSLRISPLKRARVRAQAVAASGAAKYLMFIPSNQ